MTTHALAARIARPARTVCVALFWLAMTGLSGLIVVNVLPYFELGGLHPFFLEKARVFEDVLWRVSFYIHIAGGGVCLASALPQFSGRLLHAAPGLHRALGWTYVVSVLVLVAPTGLYLAIFAKGGMAGRFGFLVLGLALVYTTARGVQHVRARDFRGHAAWMVRSYAMTASAVSFRIFYLALHEAGASDPYVAGIWLSFFVNLAIAELVIRGKRKGALV